MPTALQADIMYKCKGRLSSMGAGKDGRQKVVEAEGIDPPTSRMQSERSTI